MHLSQCIAITYNQNKRARYVRVLVALFGLTSVHDRMKHIKKVLSMHDYNADELMLVVEADESYPALCKLAKDVITVPTDDVVANTTAFAPLVTDQCYGFEQTA